MLYSILKNLLFKLPPEEAHNLTLKVANLSPSLGSISGIKNNPRLKVAIGEIDWNFPIGLAAGLDKNAEALTFFSHQGFGSIECGTITLRQQAGNPLPRLFRYPDEESLRNSMGFPNKGVKEILQALKAYEGKTPIGANIGKNKDTSPAMSIEELKLLYQQLAPFVNYFVINVSSPNTPGLRTLQEKSYLSELFSELNELKTIFGKDLFLKIAPDLEEAKVLELIELCHEKKLKGLVATNTTMIPDRGVGGVSGKLLHEKAKAIRSFILKQEPSFEVVGVGGISCSDDLFDFWEEGGKVLQIYTSYIYQGPKILKNFEREIIKFLDTAKIYDLKTFFNLPPEKRRLLIREFRDRKK